MRKTLTLALAAALLAACDAPPPAYTFACYEDGRLTVRIEGADAIRADGTVFHVRTRDGWRAIQQQPGEACGRALSIPGPPSNMD